jgi:hypothetical protein
MAPLLVDEEELDDPQLAADDDADFERLALKRPPDVRRLCGGPTCWPVPHCRGHLGTRSG